MVRYSYFKPISFEEDLPLKYPFTASICEIFHCYDWPVETQSAIDNLYKINFSDILK